MKTTIQVIKNMKHGLWMFLLTGLLFVQCTDLEVVPEDAFTEFEIFKDPQAYRSYLAKLYASFSLTGQDGPAGDSDISIVNDEGFTSYIRAYWKAQQLTTDETVIAWTDAGIRDLHNHSWSSENQFVRVIYYRVALIVSIANDFLKQSSPERLDANGIGAEDRAIIEGYRAEARFLRALAYWHALDLFRNIALATEISAGFPTQAPPAELFAFIESELNEIEPLLPGPRENEYGRVDQAGLWMLQAKLYLNAEAMIGTDRYTDCITACKKVIGAGYTLEANYRELFMKDNHTSNEIIFPIVSDGKNVQSWGSTTFLVQAAIGGSMTDSDYGVSGGWAGLRTTSAMLDKFPDLTGDIDKRAIFYTDGQTIEIDDIGEFTQGIAVPKYTNTNAAGEAGSDPTHADTDFPMFRLADAYLMYAEAILRNGAGGDLNEAIGYINDLRRRAYGNESGNVTMAEVDLPFILDERTRELYWEGHRRVDLIRYGELTDGSYVWPWKGGVKEGRSTEAFRNIFPIPASDLLANPNLRQNDGY
jgi:hypothetical protein